MTAWIVAAVLVALITIAGVFSVQRRLDRQAEGRQGGQPEMAEELRRIAQDIDRGRNAGQGFIP